MRHAWGCAHDCNGDAYTECFACGNPVCTECSARVQYRHFGVQRVAYRCLEEQFKGEPLEAEAKALADTFRASWDAKVRARAVRRWNNAAEASDA